MNSYAKQIIMGILKESIEQPKVEDAIRKHYEVEINYTPKRPRGSFSNGQGRRVIQPTTLGISSSGNMIVRAYQPYGDTQTRVPNWKTFLLDSIDDWKPTNKVFNAPPNYNPNGDKTMSTVLLNASFDEGSGTENISTNNTRKRGQIGYNPNRGNKQSIKDMSNARDFGDKNYSQTIGPVLKNNISNNIEDTKDEVTYNNALQNGPFYKNDYEKKENDNDEYESSEFPK